MTGPDAGGAAPGARWGLVLGLLFCALLLSSGIFSRNLFEQSEGRYGSLAAAMVRTGDWLVPHLNGIPHFEKPPLSMWAMALSLEVFGESEGALRIPGVLAALVALAAAWRLGALGGTRRAGLSVAFLLACPLFFGMARVVTTDIYLAACAAAALAATARALGEADPRRAGRSLDLAALAAGLGFLVKGPVILVLTLLPALLEALWSKRSGGVRRLFAPRRVLLFLVVALPWFLAVALREPGLLEWFLTKRTVAVLASSKGFHSGPVYFYLPIFLVGLLPAGPLLLLAGRAGWRRLAGDGRGRLLLLAVVVPFGVFSLSASKLATYLLPLAVPVAVLAADVLELGLVRRGLLALATGVGVLVAAAVAAGYGTGWFELVGPGSTAWLMAAAVVLLGGVVLLVAALRAEAPELGMRRALAVQVAALLLTMPAAPLAEPHLTRVGVGRDLALALAEAGSDGRPLVCYRCFLQGLPFYTGRTTRTLGWYDRERLSDEDWARVGLADEDELAALAAREGVAVVCQTKKVNALMEKVSGLVPVRVVGRYSILVCEPGAGSAAETAAR